MPDIPSHHLIYGTLHDYITGEPLVDTDDERYRQKLAQLLVEEKGYAKEDLLARLKIETLFAKSFVVSTIDLVVSILGRRFMVIRYGPGSLVTRERSALATARVLDGDYVIPLTVVTNGKDAELLDSHTGKVLALGLAAIPTRAQALSMLTELDFLPLVPGSRRQMELRILNAYDQEACCVGGPCALPQASEG